MGGALRVDGAESGDEGAEFDGDVDARKRAVGGGVEQGVIGPGRGRLAEAFDEAKIGAAVGPCDALGDDGFAKDVEREGHAVSAHSQDGGEGLVGRGAADELAGHSGAADVGGPRYQGGGRRARAA